MKLVREFKQAVFLLCAFFCSLEAVCQNSTKTPVKKRFKGSLTEVLMTLEKDHNYKFAFDESFADKFEIDKSIADLPLDEAVRELFQSYGLSHHTVNGITIVRQKQDISNKKISIKGLITDRETGERIPDAIISIGSNMTSSNKEGSFAFTDLSNEPIKVNVSHLAYHVYSQKVFNGSDTLLQIALDLKDHQLKNIEITDAYSDYRNIVSESPGHYTLKPDHLSNRASIGGNDLMQSLKLLPGINGTYQESSSLRIRGGTPSQSVIKLDGFTLFQPDHFSGFLSAINTLTIQDIQVHKGGYSAKYGGRTSGIIDITGKGGSHLTTSGSFDINLLNTNAAISMPLFNTGSFLLAYRRSYRNSAQGSLFNNPLDRSDHQLLWPDGEQSNLPFFRPDREKQEPTFNFHDFYFKVNFLKKSSDVLSATFYNGRDRVRSQQLFEHKTKAIESVDVKQEKIDILPVFTSNDHPARTNYFMSHITAPTDQEVEQTTSPSWMLPAPYSSSLAILQEFENPTRNHENTTQWGNTGGSLNWQRYWNDDFFSHYTLGISNAFSENYQEITLADSSTQTPFRAGYDQKNRIGNISLALDHEWHLRKDDVLSFGAFHNVNETSFSNTFHRDVVPIHASNISSNSGFYLQHTYNPFSNVQVTYGFRNSFYSGTQENYFEPRLSMRIGSDKLYFKSTIGRYYQFMNQVESFDQVNERPVWLLSDDITIPVLSSDQYSSGLTYKTGQWMIDLEAYYKATDGLLFSNDFSNIAFLETNLDRYTISSTNFPDNFYRTGRGRITGMDLFVQRSSEAHTFWISYTLSKSLTTYHQPNQTETIPSLNDQRHELKLHNSFRWKSWEASCTSLFGSPRTYYIPDSNGSYQNEINTAKLPATHRLDLSLGYNLKISNKLTGKITASVLNVFDHRNIERRSFTPINNPFSNENFLIQQDIQAWGFTPAINLKIGF